jgi:DNA-binding transcriptional LysR family regulator
MRTSYPATHTKVFCRRDSNVIFDQLLANKLDLAIVADPRIDRRLRNETLINDSISLVCGPKHPMHGKKRVKAIELNGLQFVSISPELPTGSLIQKYLARVGVNVQSVVSSDNLEIVRKMVEVGLGVALLPDLFVCDVIGRCDSQLSHAHIDPPLTRRIALVTWRQANMSRAVTSFVGEVRRHACEWRDCTGDDCE